MLFISQFESSCLLRAFDGGELTSSVPSGFAEDGPETDGAPENEDLRALIHVLKPLMTPAEALQVAKELIRAHGSFPGAVLANHADDDPRVVAVLDSVRSALRYMTKWSVDRRQRITRKSAIEYFRSHLTNVSVDRISVLFLDDGERLCGMIHDTGTKDDIKIYCQEIAREALKVGATRFYIGRSYASRTPQPTPSELDVIDVLEAALSRIGVLMLDFIAVSRHAYYSLLDARVESFRARLQPADENAR